MKKGKLLLADVASMIFGIGLAKVIKDDPNKVNNFEEYTKALDSRMQSMFKYSNADHYILFSDQSTNFRKIEFPTYKADRKKQYNKFLYDLIYYCNEKYGLITNPIFESDDMVCFLNKHFTEEGWDVTIGAIDSDMQQIPNAKVFNYRTFSSYNTTEEEADFALYRNILLAGHNNEISLKGCGEKTAEAYLRQFKTPSQYKYGVLKAYIEGITKVPRDPKIKDVKDDLLYIYKNVKGYGLSKGFKYFGQAFRESYLIREMYEVQEILDLHVPGTTFDIPIPIEIREEVDEVDGIEDTEIIFD